MAKFYLKDYASFNSFNDIIAVSWQISLDSEFKFIVDETIYNTDDIAMWHTPLHRLDNWDFYTENDPLFVRVKIYSNNNNVISESDWFIAELNKDRINNIKLTNPKGEVIGEYNITENGLKRVW